MLDLLFNWIEIKEKNICKTDNQTKFMLKCED